MAISKMMRAVLKALSYPDINVKKHYRFERLLVNTANYSVRKSSYITWDHVVTSGDHEIPVRIFFSAQKGPHEVLLFFHGGGWVTGNIDSYDDVCGTLAEKTNHTVVSVDYSLAPEHRFPAGFEDCYCVAREIFLKPSLFNVSADQITLIGDSAGGNLAAAVSLAARDRGEFLPARQILLYPSTYNNHSESSPFPSVKENGTDYLLTSKRVCDYMELYKSSDADLQNPYFAPLLAADFSRQPKTLIITAQYDPLRDEGEAYGQKLREGKNVAEIHRISNAMHGFFSLPFFFPQVKKSYQIINHFLSEEKQL